MQRQFLFSESAVSDSHSALRSLQYGMRLNAAKNFDDAVRVLQPVYQYYSRNQNSDAEAFAQSAYFLGCSLMELNKPELACHYLKDAYHAYFQLWKTKTEFNHEKLLNVLINSAFDLAQCRIALNKPSEAATELENLEIAIHDILKDITSDALKPILGNIYLILSEHGLASIEHKIQHMQTALEYAPNTAASIKYAILLMRNANYTQAANDLTNLVASTSWNSSNMTQLADALHYLGKCKLHLNSLDQAAIFLGKATMIYLAHHDMPAAISTKLGLALCHNKKGESIVSEHLLEEVLAYVNNVEDADLRDAAHNIISDWCETANFPHGYNLNSIQVRQLNTLFTEHKDSPSSQDKLSFMH